MLRNNATLTSSRWPLLWPMQLMAFPGSPPSVKRQRDTVGSLFSLWTFILFESKIQEVPGQTQILRLLFWVNGGRVTHICAPKSEVGLGVAENIVPRMCVQGPPIEDVVTGKKTKKATAPSLGQETSYFFSLLLCFNMKPQNCSVQMWPPRSF